MFSRENLENARRWIETADSPLRCDSICHSATGWMTRHWPPLLRCSFEAVRRARQRLVNEFTRRALSRV